MPAPLYCSPRVIKRTGPYVMERCKQHLGCVVVRRTGSRPWRSRLTIRAAECLWAGLVGEYEADLDLGIMDPGA